MLVAGGASLTISDYEGNTPRHLALRADDLELAAYLESKYEMWVNLYICVECVHGCSTIFTLHIFHKTSLAPKLL